MSYLITGLFRDQQGAAAAIEVLRAQGFTKDISVLSKDPADQELVSKDVKKDVSDGTTVGAATGAALGATAGVAGTLLLGALTVVVPGIGLVVAGPLAAGLAGAAAGALTGGVVGALVDMGFPTEKAKMYEEHIQAGEIVVAVSTDQRSRLAVESLLQQHGAAEIQVLTRQK